jgi:hypothetical protein
MKRLWNCAYSTNGQLSTRRIMLRNKSVSKKLDRPLAYGRLMNRYFRDGHILFITRNIWIKMLK